MEPIRKRAGRHMAALRRIAKRVEILLHEGYIGGKEKRK